MFLLNPLSASAEEAGIIKTKSTSPKLLWHTEFRFWLTSAQGDWLESLYLQLKFEAFKN